MVRVILPAFLGLVLLVTVVVLVTATVTSRRPRTGGAHGVPAPVSRRPVPPPAVAGTARVTLLSRAVVSYAYDTGVRPGCFTEASSACPGAPVTVVQPYSVTSPVTESVCFTIRPAVS